MLLAARRWLELLGWMPVPSESKWRGSSEFLALLCTAMLEFDEAKVSHNQNAFSQAVERTGRLWMGKRSKWLPGTSALTPGLIDLFILAFKTLDMPTVVRSNGPNIRAFTFQCPFLRQAKDDTTARLGCDVLCGQHPSLFHGMIKGVPLRIAYLAPSMMGYGDPYCVKEFEILPSPEALSEDTPTRSSAELTAAGR